MEEFENEWSDMINDEISTDEFTMDEINQDDYVYNEFLKKENNNIDYDNISFEQEEKINFKDRIKIVNNLSKKKQYAYLFNHFKFDENTAKDMTVSKAFNPYTFNKPVLIQYNKNDEEITVPENFIRNSKLMNKLEIALQYNEKKSILINSIENNIKLNIFKEEINYELKVRKTILENILSEYKDLFYTKKGNQKKKQNLDKQQLFLNNDLTNELISYFSDCYIFVDKSNKKLELETNLWKMAKKEIVKTILSIDMLNSDYLLNNTVEKIENDFLEKYNFLWNSGKLASIIVEYFCRKVNLDTLCFVKKDTFVKQITEINQTVLDLGGEEFITNSVENSYLLKYINNNLFVLNEWIKPLDHKLDNKLDSQLDLDINIYSKAKKKQIKNLLKRAAKIYFDYRLAFGTKEDNFYGNDFFDIYNSLKQYNKLDIYNKILNEEINKLTVLKNNKTISIMENFLLVYYKNIFKFILKQNKIIFRIINIRKQYIDSLNKKNKLKYFLELEKYEQNKNKIINKIEQIQTKEIQEKEEKLWDVWFRREQRNACIIDNIMLQKKIEEQPITIVKPMTRWDRRFLVRQKILAERKKKEEKNSGCIIYGIFMLIIYLCL